MKIDTTVKQQSGQTNQVKSPIRVTQISSFSDVFSSKIAPASPIDTGKSQVTTITNATIASTRDFTNMTRQELFDWMNDQIRSGKMSLDESTPFLGMTMKISATTGAEVDKATDSTRINFIERARSGFDGALLRNDLDAVKMLQMAIERMQKI